MALLGSNVASEVYECSFALSVQTLFFERHVVLWGLVYQFTVHARQLRGKIVMHKKSGFYIGQGAKQLYTNDLRPFFLKHQNRIDRVLGLTYGELHKLISAHQAEIEYARAVVMKILGSDPRLNSDIPRQNAMEGQARIVPGSGSDHED